MIMTLKKVDLSKANGCEHPDIDPNKKYLVIYVVNNIDNEIIGTFNRQWYGWNFYWFGMSYAGLQLNSFDEIWEIVE